MPQGRPRKLVNAYAEHWHIGKVARLPDMYGIYVLYDQHLIPLKVGIAGGGQANIRNRVYGQRNDSFRGRKVAFFSAYDIDSGYEKKIEALILRSLKIVLPWNDNTGRFASGAHHHEEPQ